MKDISEIRQLPVPERLELVAEIWDSIFEESAGLPISDDTFAELDRRLEEHRRNPETSRPWAEVRREVFGDE
ncbi:MAG TPA: addiction module protein [Gemmatimonadaceae bacterium]|nr:addiction module protein [Gemmatimonadaceae bacterium]